MLASSDVKLTLRGGIEHILANTVHSNCSTQETQL